MWKEEEKLWRPWITPGCWLRTGRRILAAWGAFPGLLLKLSSLDSAFISLFFPPPPQKAAQVQHLGVAIHNFLGSPPFQGVTLLQHGANTTEEGQSPRSTCRVCGKGVSTPALYLITWELQGAGAASPYPNTASHS